MTDVELQVAEDFKNQRITRQQFLFKATVLGFSLSTISTIIAACGGGSSGGQNSVTWVSPRGTLEVIDDYPYWVAKHFDWFGDIKTFLEPGPQEATATTKLVATNKADMGYPSPGVFSLALEAEVPLISVFNVEDLDTFNFAFPKGRGYTNLEELAGKRIVLGSAGWEAICDPEFAQLGIDPSSNNYVEAGETWGQALAQGKADAALSWEGLRAQWKGQGLDFDYLLGKNFSRFPANSFVVREADLEDEALRDLYTRYLQGWAMGLEFAHRNPRAATQITMKQFPALKKQMTPSVAVESLMQLDFIRRGDWKNRKGWGWHTFKSYGVFFETIAELGQVAKKFDPSKVLSNNLISGANEFDSEEIRKATKEFQLAPEYEEVNVEEIARNI